MPLSQAAIGPATVSGGGEAAGADDVSISGAALAPQVGPMGSVLDVASLPTSGGQISVYTVHAGDTLGGVAALFGVSASTVASANDLSPKAALLTGETLAILPVSGYEHTVKSGETLASIAKKTGVPAADIAYANSLDVTAGLAAGEVLFVPDTDATTSSASSDAPDSSRPSSNVPVADAQDKADSPVLPPLGPITVHPIKDTSKRDLGTALLRPVDLSVSRETQGAHGWDGCAVDLAAPEGTPIHASADGTVLLARTGGYNGGYGNYVIIMSSIDGYQVETLYAHMSRVIAVAGQTVGRGETIGLVGMTGDATGDHVHFEVRGAQNPLALDPDYTGE